MLRPRFKHWISCFPCKRASIIPSKGRAIYKLESNSVLMVYTYDSGLVILIAKTVLKGFLLDGKIREGVS